MAIIKNALTYGFGFNVTAAGPVDSRMRVNYLTDLTTVWGTSTDGVFTPNPDAPVYAGMQVIVNEQNKAYILKQQVAEGYTLDDKTQVVKNGLVYNKADDAPIAANPTDINNWVPVGTDFSGDIVDLDRRIDTLEYFNTNVVSKRLAVANDSGLATDANGGLIVKVAPNTDSFTNGVVVDSTGLKVSTYDLQQVEGNALQYNFIVNGETKTTINIPKDQFLKDVSFHATAETGVSVEAPYLKFVWDLDINEDLEGVQNVTYVPVKDLVDTYTPGDYITITNNVIDVNYAKVALNLTETLKLSEKWEALNANTAAIGDENSGLIADVAENASDISKLTGLKINNKSISTTSADGKTSIQDVILTGGDVVITGYTKGTASNLVATDTINQALGKLEARVDAAASGGVQTVNGMSGDVVIESGETNGTISVHQSGSDKVDVAVTGLKSAAFTDSTDYATSAQGSKADSAVQNVTISTNTGYPNNKIVTVTKGDDNAINLEFNCATISDIKAGSYLGELPAGGPLVRASVVAESFRTLDENKADKDTTYTKTEVDALFSWVEL